jgi:hypothetical protein
MAMLGRGYDFIQRRSLGVATQQHLSAHQATPLVGG